MTSRQPAATLDRGERPRTHSSTVAISRRPRPPGRVLWLTVAAAVLVSVAAGVHGAERGLTRATTAAPSPQDAASGTTTQQASWPRDGQTAYVIDGGQIRASDEGAGAVPIASVAKVMTAYVVLIHHPLTAGESGPTITVTAAEAADSRQRASSGQSVARLRAGQRLSERQALEALLLPSANDAAMVLARWDSGSVPAFLAAEERATEQLGMSHSTYTDPSGYLASTTSTAADQVRVFAAAMKMPAFAAVMRESFVDIPGSGRLRSTNAALDRDGIVAGKTGSTSAAGGCFAFQARRGNSTITVAVLGQPGPNLIESALDASLAFLGTVA